MLRNILILSMLSLSGCLGLMRGCSVTMAENFGADWVVVQTDFTGKPYRCWQLHDTSVTNEDSSDGIYWQDSQTGNLVHLSGLYERVQVSNGDWDDALKMIGLTQKTCDDIQAHMVAE